ncbi:hypothetical protein PLICRDRAFT_115915 [Plicaturopsis crispa FD-325 SS-3]|nr:hypothetical protein PLICRDRAFT_115915 [Plicaturopsis crispa FD-325 SS-3]
MHTNISLKTTPYGGRSLYAHVSLPKDTLVLSCETPFVSVIYRDFRKEVCANCFAYAFDAARNTWSIKCAGAGAWFCQDSCREQWDREENVGGILADLNAVFETAAKRMKRNGWVDDEPLRKADSITVQTLDCAWRAAEALNTTLSRTAKCPVNLSDMELEIARFVASAIVRRYTEDSRTASADPVPSRPLWIEFLDLQDNELPNVTSRPYILDVHIRIYRFLWYSLLPVLRPYVSSSYTVRAILARDPGNSFGIWQLSASSDSEMFGYGMYVSASYFNHGCTPNIRKERVGRALQFYTARDVDAGDELCISYVDIEDNVWARRQKLHDKWYFDCTCDRCCREAAASGGLLTLSPVLGLLFNPHLLLMSNPHSHPYLQDIYKRDWLMLLMECI